MSFATRCYERATRCYDNVAISGRNKICLLPNFTVLPVCYDNNSTIQLDKFVVSLTLSDIFSTYNHNSIEYTFLYIFKQDLEELTILFQLIIGLITDKSPPCQQLDRYLIVIIPLPRTPRTPHPRTPAPPRPASCCGWWMGPDTSYCFKLTAEGSTPERRSGL